MESAVQQAVYTALTVAGLTRVYDEVPTPTNPEASDALPYVVIGEISVEPFHTDDSEGGDFTVTLEHASRYSGRKQIKEQMAIARGALDQQELSVTGFHFVLCHWISEEVLPVEKEDGKTRMALQRFRILVD
jgi:hypothetical protein